MLGYRNMPRSSQVSWSLLNGSPPHPHNTPESRTEQQQTPSNHRDGDRWEAPAAPRGELATRAPAWTQRQPASFVGVPVLHDFLFKRIRSQTLNWVLAPTLPRVVQVTMRLASSLWAPVSSPRMGGRRGSNFCHTCLPGVCKTRKSPTVSKKGFPK